MATSELDATATRWVQPSGIRLAAWAVGACGIGLTAWAVIATGRDGVGIVWFTGLLVIAAVAALRQRVTVTAAQIEVCNGLWTWRVARTEVARLQWRTYQAGGWPAALAHVRSAGKLYVVPASGRPVAVPSTDVTNVERPRRGPAAMAAWLSAAVARPIEAGVVAEVDEWDWD